MRFSVPVFVALLAVALAGCQDHKPIGGKVREGADDITKVVSLSPNTTELVYTINYLQSLKGRTDACNWPISISRVPVCVHDTKIDYEMLAGIKPDLIVYDANLYSNAEVEKIKQLGAKTLPFEAHTLDDYVEYLKQLARLTGGETNASEYIDKVNGAASTAKGAVAGQVVKVEVLDAEGGGEMMAAGTGSFLADEVKHSGGTFVGPQGDKFMTVNVEQVIADNPDVIFCPDKSYDAIDKDPRLANVKAVKNKRVFPVDPDILLRAGGRVDQLITALGAEIQRAAVAE